MLIQKSTIDVVVQHVISPICQSDKVRLCTEGRPLLSADGPGRPPVAFAQYPRPSAFPRSDSDKPARRRIRFMGYTARTRRFRYTWWAPFDPRAAVPDLGGGAGGAAAEELYDHAFDPGEDCNRQLQVVVVVVVAAAAAVAAAVDHECFCHHYGS